mgnify:CR=1 FL=1
MELSLLLKERDNSLEYAMNKTSLAVVEWPDILANTGSNLLACTITLD